MEQWRVYISTDFAPPCSRLIDGETDGDRLDYNRIISDMRLYYIENEDEKEKDNRFYFCFPTKAIHSIEDVFRRRHDLYSNILYHHHVTKTVFLLMSSVENLAIEYLSDEDKSVHPESPEMIPLDISGLWYPLLPSQRVGREMMKNNLVQWNDSWLMTILKQIIYYLEYES